MAENDRSFKCKYTCHVLLLFDHELFLFLYSMFDLFNKKIEIYTSINGANLKSNRFVSNCVALNGSWIDV